MPNWVTNKIQAPSHVIRALLNERGVVDFNTVLPFAGPHVYESICMDAEMVAEMACCIPISDHPLIAQLETFNRSRVSLRTMREDSFKQVIGMLENYRACGYIHSMAFARDVWGTKWNAHKPTANPDEGTCQFDTAWACPRGVLVKLSLMFPNDTITAIYADEDIGNNCGTLTLKDGNFVHQDIAPRPRDQDAESQKKWTAFACEVTGFVPDPEDSDD